MRSEELFAFSLIGSFKVVSSRPTSAPIVAGATEYELKPYSIGDILQVVGSSAPSLVEFVREHEDVQQLMVGSHSAPSSACC
jgi:hypothetical protein